MLSEQPTTLLTPAVRDGGLSRAWAFLLNELNGRRPGPGEAEYASALEQAFRDSRQPVGAVRRLLVPLPFELMSG